MGSSRTGFLKSRLPATQDDFESENLRINNRIEEIRQAMLGAMFSNSGSHSFEHSQLADRVMFCHELEDLWYLRSGVMGAISSLHGEAAAKQMIKEISQMFDGFLPGTMAPRPSPFNPD